MKIVYELDLERFEAWSGGEDTLQRIIDEGKCEELEFMLEELYPDGISETQLNDLLRFEDEWIFESLDIRTESQIREELEEVREELEELLNEVQEQLEEEREDDVDFYDIIDNYKEDIESLKERIEELEEELGNL